MKLLIISMLIITGSYANAETTLLSSLRPYVEKYIGADLATTIWGEVVHEIKLPKIPKVTSNALSMDVYNKKKMESVTYPEEELNQYNVAFVNEIISVTRGVKANRNELSKWMGALIQGGTREGVYRALVLDTYYARLENYDQEMSKSAIDFSIYFMDKYIGKKITAKKIETFNIYTIKRIISEKALDIMDVYLEENEENFYDWYAHLSAEFAEDYPVWTNKLRSNKNPLAHKAWAKRVPKQFVKSEVLVKIHFLLNSLQKRN